MEGHVRGHLFLHVLLDPHLHHHPLAYKIDIFVFGRASGRSIVRPIRVSSAAAQAHLLLMDL